MTDLLRFEVWTRPDTGSFTRKFALRDVVAYELNDPIGIGQGKIVLPSDHARLSEILHVDTTDHTNDVASMIRAYIGDLPVFDFYAARRETAYTDVGDETVEITGPTPLAALDRTRVWFYDYPASPSVQRDWIYGGDDASILRNGGFEDNSAAESQALINGDAETGDTTGWATTDSLGPDFRSVEDWGVTDAQARSGTYSLWFDPGIRHSGIWQTFKVEPGKRVHIVGYLLEPTAAGKRYTMAAKVGTGWVDNNPALNQFVYNGYLMAELGNVPSTGTGLPGGSSDGTWQKFELDFNAGTDQTSVTLVIQYDHHDGSNGPIAYVDDIKVDGFGLGLEPWAVRGSVSLFELDTTVFDEGSQSCKWQPSSGVADADLLYQQVALEPGKTYTMSARVYHTDGADRLIRFAMRRVGGTWIQSTSVLVPTATWTTLQLTLVADVEDAEFTIASSDTSTLPIWTDRCAIGEGLPAATLGQIWLDLLADAQTDHAPARQALTWVVPTFTASVDSSGQPWADPELSVVVKRGSSYGRFLGVASKWGYEHRLEWNETNSRFEFDVFNPGGMGTTITGAGIVGARGGVVRSSPLVAREPDANYALVEGSDGAWAESVDATIESIWGRSETYDGSKELAGTTLPVQAAARIAEAADRSQGLKVTLQQPAARPWIDFDKGDRITVTLGASAAPQATRRVTAIVCTSGDPAPVWQIDLDSRVFSGGSAVAEGVRRLLGKFDGLEDIKQQTVEVAAAATAESRAGITLLVAASDAPSSTRERADYVCDGTDDQEEIRAAITAVAGSGAAAGTVELSEGYFSLSIPAGGFAIDLPAGMSLRGQGLSATFLSDDTTTDPGAGSGLIKVASYGTISGLQAACYWDNVPTIHVAAGSWLTAVEDCWVQAADAPAVYAAGSTQYLTVRRNHINAGSGIETWGAVHFDANSNHYWWVVDNKIEGGGSGVLVAGGSAFGGTVARNTIHATGWSGVKLVASGTSAPAWIRVVGNLIYAAAQSAATLGADGGVALIGAAGAVWADVSPGNQIGSIVAENTIENVSAGHGIYLDESPGVKVYGNSIEQAAGHGIYLQNSDGAQISNNLVAWPSQWFPAGSYDGINITSTDYGLIVGNLVRPEQPPSTLYMRYGIRVETGCTGNAIRGNDVRLLHASTVAYSDAGTGTLWGPAADQWDQGLARTDGAVVYWDDTAGAYRLKAAVDLRGNFGSAVITDGSSFTTVTHGLSATPTSVTVTSTTSEQVWVANLTATTFDINRAGTTGNLTVYWRADV